MKSKFIQWWSIIPPIEKKQKNKQSLLISLNINKHNMFVFCFRFCFYVYIFFCIAFDLIIKCFVHAWDFKFLYGLYVLSPLFHVIIDLLTSLIIWKRFTKNHRSLDFSQIVLALVRSCDCSQIFVGFSQVLFA